MGRVTDITVNDLRAIETEIEFPQYRRDTERNLTIQQAIIPSYKLKRPR